MYLRMLISPLKQKNAGVKVIQQLWIFILFELPGKVLVSLLLSRDLLKVSEIFGQNEVIMTKTGNLSIINFQKPDFTFCT